jgi:hypothetical protein
MKKLFVTSLIVFVSAISLAKTLLIDPDILPALPDGPPKAASRRQIDTARTELIAACKTQFEKGTGLSEKKVSGAAEITKLCNCVGKNMAGGKNIEEMTTIANFYRGVDDDVDSRSESYDMYIHEATKLEANCKSKSTYKVGQPEPRLNP